MPGRTRYAAVTDYARVASTADGNAAMVTIPNIAVRYLRAGAAYGNARTPYSGNKAIPYFHIRAVKDMYSISRRTKYGRLGEFCRGIAEPDYGYRHRASF